MKISFGSLFVFGNMSNTRAILVYVLLFTMFCLVALMGRDGFSLLTPRLIQSSLTRQALEEMAVVQKAGSLHREFHWVTDNFCSFFLFLIVKKLSRKKYKNRCPENNKKQYHGYSRQDVGVIFNLHGAQDFFSFGYSFVVGFCVHVAIYFLIFFSRIFAL